jgi:hypothetical protein
VIGSSVKRVVTVAYVSSICVTVDSAGTFPVTVRVTVVGVAGAIVVVTVTTFVEVLRSVFVIGLGSYVGQNPLQNLYPLWFFKGFTIASWLTGSEETVSGGLS